MGLGGTKKDETDTQRDEGAEGKDDDGEKEEGVEGLLLHDGSLKRKRGREAPRVCVLAHKLNRSEELLLLLGSQRVELLEQVCDWVFLFLTAVGVASTSQEGCTAQKRAKRG